MTGTGNEIAIIGMAGRFPGAPDLASLWRNLRSGMDSISRFDHSDLESSPLLPERLRHHPDFVPAGGVLADADLFDHDLFGLSLREAQWMDPQQRVFLEVAWAALEDAGYDPHRTDERVAVYAGAGLSGHLPALLALVGGEPASQYEALGTGASESLATRVSYLLGLRGESVTVHTACSTGLAAVHLACQSLLAGQAGMALAGAVRLSVPQRTGYVYQEGMILSRDGYCRAFDHRASGTVPGNGAGAVLLRPLADALAAGDQVHAVILGSALNNDGHRGVSYTAPSVSGQAEVVAEALAFAGRSAAEIGYVEAHGTGTPLGDPIEVAALTRAFRRTTDRVGDCPIGSVKTNIGHLDTAAGIAGLLKVVLMLRHHEIPPSLHLERPNPAIDFAESPFVVNTALRRWQRNGGPTVAGVSSFGIGGTNVHAVVAEPPRPAAKVSGSRRPCQLVTLAARTRPALSKMAASLAESVTDHTDVADLAYTRAVGRVELRHRRTLVVASPEELVTGLRRDTPEGRVSGGEIRVAFLFPGQGAARNGMAADLAAAEPVFGSALDECLSEVEPRLGRPVRPALLEGDGPIDDPAVAHAGLFAIEYALAQWWLACGIQPAALVGHSFGEYPAACLAGVLGLPEAASLAVARGQLVARLPEGAMMAVGLGTEQLESWLDEKLSLAAVNGDRRCVVSGPVGAIEALRDRLAAAGHPAVMLPVRHAFHSPAVEPVLEELAARAAGLPHHTPRVPLLSTLHGDWWPSGGMAPGYWARQMREPVRFGAALQRLAESTPADQQLVLVEVGPDQALTALARDQLGEGAVTVPSLRARRGRGSDHRVLLRGLGTLWRAGARVDWPAFYRDERRHRVRLPSYPFEGVDCRLPAPAGSGTDGVAASATAPPVPAEPAPAPAGVAEPAPPAELDGPRDEIERKVAEIWRERLGTGAFGVHDNFLELGGNSLVAAQVLTRLRDTFAAPIPLSALFEAPTVAGLAERIRAVTGTDGATGTAPTSAGPTGDGGLPPVRPVPRGTSVPLSVVQERTLALAAADPTNPALAMPVAVTIDGELDRAVLERAVQAVVERHESLRTTFHYDGSQWTAQIGPGAVEVPHEDVPGGEADAQQIARAEPAWPFDLSTSPIRVRVLRLAPDRHVLLATVHHVVSDTLSMAILVQEIATCYRAFLAEQPPPLPPLPAQYADFATWQRELLRSGALAWQQAYWQERLSDPPAPLRLPVDHSGAASPGTRGGQVEVALPAELSRRVVEFSRRVGVTPFVTLLAAYVALLSRVTGADDMVVGTPVANRDRPELEPLIGYVAHSLPLRADLRADPRFVTLVEQLQQTLLAAYAHPDVPYEQLVPAGDGRLFDAVFILHAQLPREQRVPRATWRLWPVREAPAMFGATLAALTLMLAESPEGYAGVVGYAAERFREGTARSLFGHFQALLEDALRRPETRVSALRADRQPPPPVSDVDTPGERPLHLDGAGLPAWISPARRRPQLQISLSYFANDEDELAGHKYQLLLEGVRLADRGGLAAVWTPERHFHSFGGLYPNPTATSAALAAATTRIGIRAGSVVLPLHDPIRVAEDWAVIDNISGGRVGVSFASGWHPDDFVLAPDGFPQRRESLREGIETVRALWRGEPVRRRNGVGEEVEVEIRPRPVQAQLPFWLTAAGSPHTFALAGTLGAGVLTNLMAQSLADLAEKIQIYRKAWREAGHDRDGWAGDDGHVTLMLHAFLADDPETAYATARGPLLRYFRSSMDIARGFAVAQGLAVRPADLSEDDVRELLEHGLERYLRQGGLFGDPRTCAGVLEQVRELGVDEVAALVDYGTSLPDTLHSIRLLGELAEHEAKRATSAAAAAAAEVATRGRELARTITGRGATTVAGPADALAWVAETAPEALAGRTVLVSDVDPAVELLRMLSVAADRVFVPAPELPDGSLPARWVQWYDGQDPVVIADGTASVVDVHGRPVGVGVVGELTVSGTATGQRARWRRDGRLDLMAGPVVRANPLPLSYAQQRIWSVAQLSPGNLAYHNAVALRLRGQLDSGALHRALHEVVCRHEVLRTTYHATDLGPVQVVDPDIEVALPVQDAHPDDVDGLARAHAREPFDLERGPLVRARLLRLAGTDHVLLISMHHIISDGWSAGVLVQELGTLYAAFRQGEESSYPLAPLPVQYADYALAQRQDDDALAAQLDYWVRTLADLPLLELPTDRPRPAVQGQHGARAPVHIDRSLTETLTSLAHETGSTLFMLLYAGLATLLHRHSGQADLAIGTAVAGRTPQTEPLVGVFINTVMIRTNFAGDPSFLELLARTKRSVLDALAHQEVPFERLVDALKVPRDPSRAPLCQALLVLHNTPTPRLSLDELTLEALEVDPGTAKLDLTVELREGPDGIRGAFEYDTDLFEEATVTLLTRQLVRLLADAAAGPHRRLSELAWD